MGKYETIFRKVGNAKALTSWAPSVPAGKHRVALVKYGGKTSAKDRSVFLEAEFIILSSTNANVKPGSLHSWPWFINKPDEYGYTHARAKNFLEVLQKCIGNEADTTSFGDSLAEDFESGEPEGYGIELEVDVVLVTDANGAARRGKKGAEIFNASWSPVLQTREAIMKTRMQLVSLATVPAPAPAAAAATAGAAAPSNGMSRLIGQV